MDIARKQRNFDFMHEFEQTKPRGETNNLSDPASFPVEKIYETSLKDEVEKRYLAYALSTIVSRALPDVRMAKTIHRRILYAMHGMEIGRLFQNEEISRNCW